MVKISLDMCVMRTAIGGHVNPNGGAKYLNTPRKEQKHVIAHIIFCVEMKIFCGH